MRTLALFISCLVFAACSDGDNGGGSGVAGSKQLVSLSDSEIDTFCDYTSEFESREITCNGETVSIDVATKAECVAHAKAARSETPNCKATVGDAERCAEDLDSLDDAELCEAEGVPPSCAPLFTAACLGLE